LSSSSLLGSRTHISLLRTINSTALIHRTTRSTLDLSLILDLNIYVSPSAPIHAETLAPFTQTSTASSSSAPCCDSPDHDHSSHSHPNPPVSSSSIASSPHANDISSVTLPLPVVRDVRGGVFHELISTLIWEGKLPPPTSSSPSSAPSTEEEEPLDLLRSKGFLRTLDGRSWILQGVREIYDIAEVPQSVLDKAREEGKKEVESKLVLIGRGLGDAVSVRTRFAEALRKGIEEEERERGKVGEVKEVETDGEEEE
jgi:G3E family GTPase